MCCRPHGCSRAERSRLWEPAACDKGSGADAITQRKVGPEPKDRNWQLLSEEVLRTTLALAVECYQEVNKRQSRGTGQDEFGPVQEFPLIVQADAIEVGVGIDM